MSEGCRKRQESLQARHGALYTEVSQLLREADPIRLITIGAPGRRIWSWSGYDSAATARSPFSGRGVADHSGRVRPLVWCWHCRTDHTLWWGSREAI